MTTIHRKSMEPYMYIQSVTASSGWWFGTLLFFFHIIRNNHPNWLSYFSEGLKPPHQSCNWFSYSDTGETLSPRPHRVFVHLSALLKPQKTAVRLPTAWTVSTSFARPYGCCSRWPLSSPLWCMTCRRSSTATGATVDLIGPAHNYTISTRIYR